jgi:hypothetical protein
VSLTVAMAAKQLGRVEGAKKRLGQWGGRVGKKRRSVGTCIAAALKLLAVRAILSVTKAQVSGEVLQLMGGWPPSKI